jgi:hypothetical protein
MNHLFLSFSSSLRSSSLFDFKDRCFHCVPWIQALPIIVVRFTMRDPFLQGSKVTKSASTGLPLLTLSFNYPQKKLDQRNYTDVGEQCIEPWKWTNSLVWYFHAVPSVALLLLTFTDHQDCSNWGVLIHNISALIIHY